jgi:uncharacterized protein (TIGR02145 family)
MGATICTAQTISISGIVKDTAGIGISGATVTLENASISTMTGAGGSFTLTNDPTAIQPNVTNRTLAASAVRLQNGKLVFTLSGNTPVSISILDIGGRQIYKNKKTYGSGTHGIYTPLQGAGIYLHRVSIGNETHTFKSLLFGTFLTERTVVSNGTSALANQAKPTGVIADVLFIVKEGQLNYRDSIRASDTSGILVKMIPNAGNVTDADGGVYQSVRIGSQVWTVENWRCTKYNDGTTIPNVTESGESGGITGWQNLATGAYCYFENNAANNAKYGALYNWFAVNTGKLAPAGWRVPTDADWDTLQNYLIEKGYNWDGTATENKIAKSMAAKTDWTICTVEGTVGNDLSKNNASGFSALPGGNRSHGGDFCQSCPGYWWSATEFGSTHANYRYIGYDYYYLDGRSFYKCSGYSVRLLRD